MKTKHIALSAMYVLIVQTTMPSPWNYLSIAILCLIFARHFYKLGGRWTDDYSRTLCRPKHWQDEERRLRMEECCLWYRVSIIALGLMLAAVVVL